MKKALGFISGSYLYLLATKSIFAQAPTPTPTPISLRIDDPSKLAAISTQNVFQFVVNFLFTIGLILAIIFLIWGGIKWIFSRGDKTKVEEARSHIVAAIVGLIFIIAAFVIINVVVTLLTGKSFTEFLNLPTLKDTSVPTLTPTPTPS